MSSGDSPDEPVDVSGVDLAEKSNNVTVTKWILIGCAGAAGIALLTYGIVAIVMATSPTEVVTTTTTLEPTLPQSTTTTTVTTTTTTTPGTTTTTTPPTTTTTTPGTTTTPPPCDSCVYRIGRGLADITGLAADGVLYGYANPGLDARGLHLRQFSRAFVFEEKSGDMKRLLIIVAEVSLISEAMRKRVIDMLNTEFPDGRYGAANVMLAPNHSHSTPGGMNTYFLYMVPSGGMAQPTFDNFVNGVVESVKMADADLHDSHIYVNTGEAPTESSRSRSRYAYEFNPQEERDRYPYDRDLNMTTLKITNGNETARGMLNLFPVHTTSMQNSNHLVSSDNSGYAAQLLERDMDPEAFPGTVDFVAAFAQTAEGDVTPCSLGEFCNGTDEMCSYNRSNCPENPMNPQLCRGRGPGVDMIDDTRIIGQHLHDTAKTLFDSAVEEVTGPIDYRFQFVNMSDVVISDDGENVTRTCRPAMGYSFAAGGTNGPGIPPFTQGELEGFPVLNSFIEQIFGLPDDLVACHEPKPILLPTGTMPYFWDWQPEILPIQLFRIGDLVLIGLPVEVTTMPGRRIKEAIKQVLVSNGLPSTVTPIIMSMTNNYASYLTTYEEYQAQRYEGASTIFGPHELEAFILELSVLAEAMAKGEPVDVDSPPPDLLDLPGDGLPPERLDLLNCTQCTYGDVIEDADGQYRQGEFVVVRFLAASPRHYAKTGDSHLTVERKGLGDSWSVEYADAHWETRFYWDSSCHDIGTDIALRRSCNNFASLVPTSDPSQESTATIVWDIPENQRTGTYRIRYMGRALTEIKIIGGKVFQEFTGTSSEFEVIANTRRKWPKRRFVPLHDHRRNENTDAEDDVMVGLLGEPWKALNIPSPKLAEIIGNQ